MTETVVIASADGHEFRVPAAVAKMSRVVGDMLQDLDDPGAAVPVSVSSKTLGVVLHMCTDRVVNSKPADDPSFKEVVAGLDREDKYDLLVAANYLDVKFVLEAGAKHIASLIEGKTVEEMREVLGVENDFTPQEEEELRRENQWAFE